MVTKFSCAVVAGLCLLGLSAPSFGLITPILGPTTGAFGTQIGDYNVGYEFTVGTNPVAVLQVGVYDVGHDGLTDSHAITFVDETTSTPISLPTVPAANNPGAVDFLYISLPTPITLTPGHTYLLEEQAGTNDGFFTAGFFGGIGYDAFLTTGATGYIGNLQAYYNGLTNPQPGASGFVGPNLVLALPEPASLSLACLGCVMLLRRGAKTRVV